MNTEQKRRVLFTASVARHIRAFHLPYLKWFKERGWETWVAAKGEHDGSDAIPHCDHFVEISFDRSPFSIKNIRAYSQLRRLTGDVHFDVIHTHTPTASVLTRLAARNGRLHGVSVLYTAHGFRFYRGASPITWLLWFPIERWMSRFTDVLITINHEDFACAKRFAHCRVEYVPGVGIDLKRFSRPFDRDAKRRELDLSPDEFALLSVGRLIKMKNQEAVVRALPLLPKSVSLVCCGTGGMQDYLQGLAERLGVSERVRFLGLRKDIPEIVAACDCLVFPSYREGLPVAVMEAMAGGLPVIASAIRGVTPDLIINREDGLLLSSITPKAIAAAVQEMLEDEDLRSRLSSCAMNRVRHFELDAAVKAMASVYSSLYPSLVPEPDDTDHTSGTARNSATASFESR